MRVEVTGTISPPSAASAIAATQSTVPAPVSAAELQQRLMMSGLPERATSRMSVAAAGVTAFPPAQAMSAGDQTSAGMSDAAPTKALEHERPVAASEPAVVDKPTRDTRKLDALIARGEQLLANGEVVAARLFFGRAAEEGDARGARGMARSYDEGVLRTLPVADPPGSNSEAQRWYRRAAELNQQQEWKSEGRSAAR
ncbi:hypothetical protein [Methylobacterium nigriterrae]|uniref:hypothetical protein n=1 Tax=Methylobacterium nigriterrae TaxID=3127512 RepID=UPI003013F7AD